MSSMLYPDVMRRILSNFYIKDYLKLRTVCKYFDNIINTILSSKSIKITDYSSAVEPFISKFEKVSIEYNFHNYDKNSCIYKIYIDKEFCIFPKGLKCLAISVSSDIFRNYMTSVQKLEYL